MSAARAIFFNINGSGLGHMTRCLAYARRLTKDVQPFFFSLASAIEIIEGMGFEAEYFVSHYWSANTTFSWNSELSVRFGMVLERVRPDVVVFDGTWPFQGFVAACESYGVPSMVWSNRGLLKSDTPTVSTAESLFDLIIEPGEVGVQLVHSRLAAGVKKIVVPPVCLLNDDELLNKTEARRELGLSREGRYVLFSLGPGNLKDVSGIGRSLIRLFEKADIQTVWARAPISVQDVELPVGIKSISQYPLARCIRAFDGFVGAAGYNTCCEVVQAQIPTLLVPNAKLADDQTLRARMVSGIAPVVVSACEDEIEQSDAVEKLLFMMQAGGSQSTTSFSMDGASIAADAISSLALEGGR